MIWWTRCTTQDVDRMFGCCVTGGAKKKKEMVFDWCMADVADPVQRKTATGQLFLTITILTTLIIMNMYIDIQMLLTIMRTLVIMNMYIDIQNRATLLSKLI